MFNSTFPVRKETENLIEIEKAAKVTGEFGKEEAEKLTTRVLKLVHESCPEPLPDVEEIQDIVEEVLFDSPHFWGFLHFSICCQVI